MLKIEQRAIEALIPYARNSRTHSDGQVAQIAASIREFGFTNPVLVDKDGGIIAGHGRVMAARKLGLKDVPCIALGHLTDAQKRAYVIADNKLALNAGWDAEALQVELADLNGAGFNMDLLGFGVDDLAEAMGMGGDFEPGSIEDQGRLDQKKPVTCPNCGHEF
jgi:ParB-like chromosome segregation protein Spo0J